ncbi:MAG: Wzz/FepE/Etk N-terminal domain-containing protein, partial [Pseudomonadota bacterium]
MAENIDVAGAEGIELGDIGAILKRRFFALLLPFIVVVVLSAIVAYALPPVFRSEATILVEGEEIPADFVETTVTGYVQQRIQELRQRILTRGRLIEIAEEIGVTEALPEDILDGDIVQLMRDSTEVAMVDVKASTGGSARQSLITIAFVVAFENDKPQVARAGARNISTLFLEENKKLREAQVAEVSEFLAVEADRLEQQVLEFESKLAAFKEKHVNELPEHASLNMRLMEQTEAKIERSEERLRSFEDRKLNVEAQISVTDPYKEVFTDSGKRVQTGLERLSVLLAEYGSKSAQYSQDHPDIVRIRREIESLDTQTGGVTGAGRILSQLTGAREALAKAKQRYSDQHPDVKKLKKKVDALDQELSEISVAPGVVNVEPEVREVPVAPDNPSYIRLQTQLDSLNAEIRAEQEKQDSLNRKINEYESRLSRSPGVERDYLAISKDYDSAKSKYKEIRNKQLKAELAEQLEKDEKGGRFTLVDPANLPSSPDRPNRLGILLIGVMLATMCGIGTAGIMEFNDNSVRGSKGIIALFNEPPLAVIPYIENTRDKSSIRFRRIIY